MHRRTSVLVGPLRERLLTRLWRLYLDAVTAIGGEALVGSSARAEPTLHEVAHQLEEDLLHFALVDPAAHGDARIILDSYSSFACLLHHRLAHALLHAPDHVDLRQRAARWLADQGKVASGADIHPAAKIGRRFVLDHAVGTVIGETAVIGNDCYLLGGVVLGARGICANAGGKRHPTLGNHVQIGGSARILGPVSIGNHVFIAPHSVITDDVPANTRVNIMNQLQVGRSAAPGASARMRVVGAGVVGNDILVLGDGFRAPRASLLCEDFEPCRSVLVEAALVAPYILKIEIVGIADPCAPRSSPRHVKIVDHDDEVVVLAPHGLTEWLGEKWAAPFHLMTARATRSQ